MVTYVEVQGLDLVSGLAAALVICVGLAILVQFSFMAARWCLRAVGLLGPSSGDRDRWAAEEAWNDRQRED
jgi:hypothetical protein